MTANKFFISMAGNIGAGKTTAAKIISQAFGFELFEEPVIDNRFLVDYYANMQRWSFTLQLEFLLKRVQHHHLIGTVNKNCIQDRTLYEDVEIFSKYLHGLGFISDKELELYYDYFNQLSSKINAPNKIILLTSPDVTCLLNRIKSRGRKEESNMSINFLQGLNSYYQIFAQICQEKYKIPVLNIDISNTDIRSEQGKKEFITQVGNFIDN